MKYLLVALILCGIWVSAEGCENCSIRVSEDGDTTVWYCTNHYIISEVVDCPKQPLRMKIDTVRVDTTGFCRDSTGNGRYQMICSDSGITYEFIPDLIWVPILQYITIKTYYLSPEQIKLLGGE